MSIGHWDSAFSLLNDGLDLDPELVQWCMNEILSGAADIETIKNFLMALKNKGENAEEVGALVAQMYQHCAPISIDQRAVDTVGTGKGNNGVVPGSAINRIVAVTTV
jgi:anthranilate phosphoribosyltransferase